MREPYRGIAVDDVLARTAPVLARGGTPLQALLAAIAACARGEGTDVVLGRAEAAAIDEAFRTATKTIAQERAARIEERSQVRALAVAAERKLAEFQELVRGPPLGDANDDDNRGAT